MLRIKDIPEDNIIFYDIETTSIFAPYCQLKMVSYQLGINGSPQLVDPDDSDSIGMFKGLLADPSMLKVSYNGINFDDIVLWRYGFYVNPKRRHDMYLALKTVHPTFPSYGLKMANWALAIDDQTYEDAWHESEWRLESWLLHHGLEKKYMYHAPQKLLAPYCMHDVTETANIFRAIWEVVQKPIHWKPYRELELAMGEPLHEMILMGQEYVCVKEIKKEIVRLEKEKEEWNKLAIKWSDGYIENIGSQKQTTNYLKRLGMKFVKSEAGNLLYTKADKIFIITTEKEDKEDARYRFKNIKRNDSHGSTKGAFDAAALEGMDIGSLDKVISTLQKVSIDNVEPKDRILAINYCSYGNADTTKVLGYLRSYLRAANYERRLQNGDTSTNSKRKNGEFFPINNRSRICQLRSKVRFAQHKETNNGDRTLIAIPKSYSLSAARTRRFKSNSRFGINFQNQNERSKIVQLVPPGWLGFWIDSTQIENVAHIFFSEDNVRRASYEADPDWSEYVWLTNEILGGVRNREELESIPSPENPQWSVYKQYKTIKLALNFGMGPDKFTKTTGQSRSKANRDFARVHIACPAIKNLQNIVRRKVQERGYVRDPFGHIYSGNVSQAYKIVAYLVQGCGTGSVPKAMTVANYESIHSLDSNDVLYSPFIQHPYTGRISYGMLCGTTHDESSGRLSLGLPTTIIVKIIKELLYNMEQKFSPLFDGIPLRAKLVVSITNASDYIKLDHRKPEFVKELIAIIKKGKKQL
jgi:hypothetical protein